MPRWVFVVALSWLAVLIALFFVWITSPGLRSDLPSMYGKNPGIPVEAPWFGAIGGILASLGGIFYYSRGRWLTRFNYWHAVKPLVGAVTGGVSCVLLVVVLRAASGDGNVGTNPTTFDATAFVFGYAESSFRQLIKTVTDVLLKPGGETSSANKGRSQGGGGGGAAAGAGGGGSASPGTGQSAHPTSAQGSAPSPAPAKAIDADQPSSEGLESLSATESSQATPPTTPRADGDASQ